jgi:hypothetical protein
VGAGCLHAVRADAPLLPTGDGISDAWGHLHYQGFPLGGLSRVAVRFQSGALVNSLDWCCSRLWAETLHVAALSSLGAWKPPNHKPRVMPPPKYSWFAWTSRIPKSIPAYWTLNLLLKRSKKKRARTTSSPRSSRNANVKVTQTGPRRYTQRARYGLPGIGAWLIAITLCRCLQWVCCLSGAGLHQQHCACRYAWRVP